MLGKDQVNNPKSLTTSVPCYRCGGTGYLPEFKHVEGGICFRCRGRKEITRISLLF